MLKKQMLVKQQLLSLQTNLMTYKCIPMLMLLWQYMVQKEIQQNN